MSDYLNSIKNLDEIGTKADAESHEPREVIPVIEKNVIVSNITEAGDEIQDQPMGIDSASYMELHVVKVKKYRLKK